MTPTNRPPLDIVLGTSIATFMRRNMPNATPNRVHATRMGLGLGAALLMVPGHYVTNVAGAVLFVAALLLRRTASTLHSLLRRQQDLTDVRIDHLGNSLILILMILCIGVGQIKTLGGQAVGLAMLAALFIAALRVLLIYRAEQQEDKPIWQYTWQGYNAPDLLYLLPLITLVTLTHVVLPAAVIVTPLLVLWAIYRIIRHN